MYESLSQLYAAFITPPSFEGALLRLGRSWLYIYNIKWVPPNHNDPHNNVCDEEALIPCKRALLVPFIPEAPSKCSIPQAQQQTKSNEPLTNRSPLNLNWKIVIAFGRWHLGALNSSSPAGVTENVFCCNEKCKVSLIGFKSGVSPSRKFNTEAFHTCLV